MYVTKTSFMQKKIEISLQDLDNMLKIMHLQGKLSEINPAESHNLGYIGLRNDLLSTYNIEIPE